ncbi:MAG: Gfo/Idh/MocA family protein [Coraliomargaritaceae bacterium]
MNRRDFVRKSTTLAAGASLLPRFSIGKPGTSANSKLNIAMIGAGNIAQMAYGGCRSENIVALADVDARQFHQHKERFPEIENAKKFTDFRVMLDKMGKDIDAVCINTPDHTHFVATIDAMQRSKHVITQKPLTHNIWQARTLRKAKHKYGVVTNMCNQGHTFDGIRQMREWYEADVFGQITEVHMGFSGPNWEAKAFSLPPQVPLEKEKIPAELNWDLFLGPVHDRPYNGIFHPMTWRGFYDLGTGQFGDWFCHIGDGAVWILDLYEPVVVECIERGDTPMEGMIPQHSVVRYDFPARGNKAPCSMYWYDGMRNGGTRIPTPKEWDIGKPPATGSYWYGTKQNGFLDQRSNHPRLTTVQAMKDFNKGEDISQTYARVTGGPFKEWIHAIKGEGPEPGSNFDYAAPMTEVALIGVLAQRFGGRIEWHPEKGILNRPELNSFVKEPARKGWEYGETLWNT